VPFNINEFIANGLPLGGARPTLFDVQVTFPNGQGFTAPELAKAPERLRFTCNASSIPPSIIGSVDVGYFGRFVKVSGDRRYENWSVNVLNDEDYIVRKSFELWHNAINDTIENRKMAAQPGESSAAGYKGTAIINQYSKTGKIIARYTMVNIFPIALEGMNLSWDAQNQIQTFGVTFAYDYWLPEVSRGSR